MEYNILSLALGCFAWITAILAILARTARVCHCLSFCSFGLCSFSLISQFYNIRYLCNKGDFSAIDDTIGAVIFAAVVLSGVTLLLNLAATYKAERSR